MPNEVPTKGGGQIAPMTSAFIQISGVFAELEFRIVRDQCVQVWQTPEQKSAKSADRK